MYLTIAQISFNSIYQGSRQHAGWFVYIYSAMQELPRF